MVYAFISEKWSVITVVLFSSWVVALVFGVLLYTATFATSNEVNSIQVSLLMYIAVLIIITVPITVLFGALTFHYIKHNTLQGNAAVKGSVTKNLTIQAVITILGNLLPITFAFVRAAPNDEVIVNIIVGQYILQLHTFLLAAATPVATIIILKLMQPAMKQMFRKVCSKCEAPMDKCE